MLNRVYLILSGGRSNNNNSNFLSFTVVNPLKSGHNTGSGTDQQAVSKLPAPLNPEDYEVRFSVDLVHQVLQPLNVIGIKEPDEARLQIYLLPQSDANGTPLRPEKVYEAPAHEPKEPMAYRAGREYLFCLKFNTNDAVGLLSVKFNDEDVQTKELGALPYWTMKWLQRAGRENRKV